MPRFRFHMPPLSGKRRRADGSSTMSGGSATPDDLVGLATRLEHYAAQLREAASAYAFDAPRDQGFDAIRATLMIGGIQVSRALNDFAAKA